MREDRLRAKSGVRDTTEKNQPKERDDMTTRYHREREHSGRGDYGRSGDGNRSGRGYESERRDAGRYGPRTEYRRPGSNEDRQGRSTEGSSAYRERDEQGRFESE